MLSHGTTRSYQAGCRCDPLQKEDRFSKEDHPSEPHPAPRCRSDSATTRSGRDLPQLGVSVCSVHRSPRRQHARLPKEQGMTSRHRRLDAHPGFAVYHKDCGHILGVAPQRHELAGVIARGEEHGVYGLRIRVAKAGDLGVVRQSQTCSTCAPWLQAPTPEPMQVGEDGRIPGLYADFPPACGETPTSAVITP